MAHDPVITVAGLTKRFDRKVAVDDLSFEIDAGSIAGFWGRTARERRRPCAAFWASSVLPQARQPFVGVATSKSPIPSGASALLQGAGAYPASSPGLLRVWDE